MTSEIIEIDIIEGTLQTLNTFYHLGKELDIDKRTATFNVNI